MTPSCQARARPAHPGGVTTGGVRAPREAVAQALGDRAVADAAVHRVGGRVAQVGVEDAAASGGEHPGRHRGHARAGVAVPAAVVGGVDRPDAGHAGDGVGDGGHRRRPPSSQTQKWPAGSRRSTSASAPAGPPRPRRPGSAAASRRAGHGRSGRPAAADPARLPADRPARPRRCAGPWRARRRPAPLGPLAREARRRRSVADHARQVDAGIGDDVDDSDHRAPAAAASAWRRRSPATGTPPRPPRLPRPPPSTGPARARRPSHGAG